jgi:hypothetical protein
MSGRVACDKSSLVEASQDFAGLLTLTATKKVTYHLPRS